MFTEGNESWLMGSGKLVKYKFVVVVRRLVQETILFVVVCMAGMLMFQARDGAVHT